MPLDDIDQLDTGIPADADNSNPDLHVDNS
jgi:hypothetical protein